MSTRNASLSLRVLARLLDYPTDDLRSNLSELSAALDEEGALSAGRRAELGRLMDEIRRKDQLDVEASYVDLFDRGRATSLHLF